MSRLLLSLVALACSLGVASAATPNPFGALVAPAPPSRAADITAFRLIAHREAASAGLPFDLVDAVMAIESDYRPDRIGDVGEIGLMQVRPATAAMLGFRGLPAALADPALNIHYGAAYLGQAWHLAGGDVCRALMKYRAGHGEEAMTALSVRYCARARDHRVARGSALAPRIPEIALVASRAEPDTLRSAGRPARTAFWARFEARIGRINARLEAKWRRVATR